MKEEERVLCGDEKEKGSLLDQKAGRKGNVGNEEQDPRRGEELRDNVFEFFFFVPG